MKMGASQNFAKSHTGPKTKSLLINIHISFLTTVHFFASNETYFNHKKEDIFDFSRCIPSIN